MATVHVEPASEEDLPRLMEILAPAFGPYSFAQLVGEINTPPSRNAMVQRHAHTWREHAKSFRYPMGVKCVYTDSETGKETIISTATWAIYDRPRTEEEYLTPNYLVSADWVEDASKRAQAQREIKPLLDGRVRWMGGRPYGVLMFMATDPAYQRLGAAKKCVEWGLEKCKELGIPAYLQSTDAGAPVYERLGHEVMERIKFCGKDATIMIAWPEGTREEDKRPALPGYGQSTN